MRRRDTQKHKREPLPALNLDALDRPLSDAVREVLDPLDLIEAPGGYTVERMPNDGKHLRVILEGRSLRISAPTTVGFLRGISHFNTVLETGEIIEEEQQFETNGVMLDCSRNAVATVDTVKAFLRYLALMGLNQLMLYTEDTYEVRDYPYFGYLRGAYSEFELSELDDYASLLGIELVPCIQTLAHLKTTLHWPHGEGIRDTEDILLVDEPKTYAFITDLLEAASRPFRSRKIHLGMDEAHMLGLGRYLEQHGYQDRFEIMSRHLDQVSEIARSLELEPMIWSDMYFRLAYGGQYYAGDADGDIPQEVKDRIPQDIGLVYWDYYHTDPATYEQMLTQHRELSDQILFAGGLWTWNGLKVNHGRMFATTEAALQVCRQQGIQHVFATAWGDNGQETFLMEALPGMQAYGEYGWRTEQPTRQQILDRLEICSGTNAEAFYAMRLFDEVPRVEQDNLDSQIVSKQVL